MLSRCSCDSSEIPGRFLRHAVWLQLLASGVAHSTAVTITNVAARPLRPQPEGPQQEGPPQHVAQGETDWPAHDCSLAGEWDAAAGACVCDPGWRGPSCLQVAITTSTAVVRHSNWSWGGSPIFSHEPTFSREKNKPGELHLFVSVMTEGCGLLHYQTNSVVQHVVSTRGPQGPFTWQGTALAPRAGQWDSSAIHGPSVHFDGTASHGRHCHVEL